MRLACPYQLSPTQNLLGNGAQLSARNAAGGDPYWANVVLLVVNDNAADGTTTFIDQSASAHTIAVGGNTQYDTAQAPSGMTSSALFDGTGDYLNNPTDADFNFGTADFTIEAFFRSNSTAATRVVVDNRDSGTGIGPLLYTNTQPRVIFHANGATRATSGLISTGTWYHGAISRASGVSKAFLDGVQFGSDYTDANNYPQANLSIGSHRDLNAFFWNGWIGNVRITKGAARYTANFTPPTLPMPTS